MFRSKVKQQLFREFLLSQIYEMSLDFHRKSWAHKNEKNKRVLEGSQLFVYNLLCVCCKIRGPFISVAVRHLRNGSPCYSIMCNAGKSSCGNNAKISKMSRIRNIQSYSLHTKNLFLGSQILSWTQPNKCNSYC